MAAIKHLLGVARGPFLLLPVTLVASGTAASAWDGELSRGRAALALLGLVSLHVGVNALNEASDMRTGIDLATRRTPFSGGSGTLPSGALSVGAAYAVGFVGAGLGALVGAWFLREIGWPLVPLVLAGALLVLGYTDLLARAGVGEVAAGLGLGALPVIGTSLVQDGHVGPAALAASIPAFFMTFNLLLLNEFPDEEADRAGGRRNLVLLLGRPAAAGIYAAAVLLTLLSLLVAAVLRHLPWLSLAALLPSALLVGPVGWALRRPREAVPVPALGANVAWILSTNTLLAAALALAVTWRGG